MKKDFDGWNAKKSDLNNIQNVPFFREREIWFCHIGLNISSEEDGSGKDFLRPVLIMKKTSKTAFIGIPLTRTPRFGKFYFPINDDHGASSIILSQIRAMDARRLLYRSRIMPEDLFCALRQFVLCFLK